MSFSFSPLDDNNVGTTPNLDADLERAMDWDQAASAEVLTTANNRDKIARRNNPRAAPAVAPVVVGVHPANHRLDIPSLSGRCLVSNPLVIICARIWPERLESDMLNQSESLTMFRRQSTSSLEKKHLRDLT